MKKIFVFLHVPKISALMSITVRVPLLAVL